CRLTTGLVLLRSIRNHGSGDCSMTTADRTGGRDIVSRDHKGPSGAGPLGLTGRVPAPDLARGFMLLLIALANTPAYLYGQAQSGAGFQPVDGSLVDRVVQVVLISGVDLRVYPMFALLFGYGLAMVYRRQRDHGRSEPAARRLLQRRN